LSYDDNADLLEVEQDDQQSHEEDTNRDGNESSDDNDNADLLEVEQDDQQSHEEDTNRDGNESSDDNNDNADFVHPFAPSAQQLKDQRKLDKYVEIYTEEGPYWADLWEKNRPKYYRMKNQKKKKKGNYRTDMQVDTNT
jgi:hypothetical protein